MLLAEQGAPCLLQTAAVAAGAAAGCGSPTNLPTRPPAAARPACSEELQQPVFVAIDALEFPELHDESIPAVAFVRHLGRLLAAAGVRDFSLKARPGWVGAAVGL